MTVLGVLICSNIYVTPILQTGLQKCMTASETVAVCLYSWEVIDGVKCVVNKCLLLIVGPKCTLAALHAAPW